MRRVATAGFAAVVLALVLGYLSANRDRGPDATQIVALVERGRQAIEQKSLPSAMSCISKNYRDEAGLNYDRVRLLAGDAFRAASAYEVTVRAPNIDVRGDEAVARTHVTVSAVRAGTPEEVFSGEVTLQLAKERARRYLIFPVREWKVSSIDGVGSLEVGG